MGETFQCRPPVVHTTVIMRGLVCLLAFLPAALCIDCANEQDGIYEMGCKAFTRCSNGVATIEECGKNMVFDQGTGQCADEMTVGAPCGLVKDCSNAVDGLYADTDQQCTSYYPCTGGTYFGHNYCAGGLVFNEALQTCDWPDDTPPLVAPRGRPSQPGPWDKHSSIRINS